MKQQVENFIEEFSGYYVNGEGENITAHKPILIGDVLEKMDKSEKICPVEYTKRVVTIINDWSPLGFTKSIQQIIEESGWENGLQENKNGGAFITEQLKDPQAQTLIEFILSLKL